MLDSMQEIFDKMEAGGLAFWEVVLETDMDQRQVTREESLAKMRLTRVLPIFSPTSLIWVSTSWPK